MPKDAIELSHSYRPHYFNRFYSMDFQSQEPNRKENIKLSDSNNEKHVFEEIRKNEQQAVIQALLDENGNITRAAKRLKITRRALFYRMKKHSIPSKRAG